MADGADLLLATLVAAGLVGMAFHGFASYKIGEKIGKWGSPYFAVYVVLLMAALAPTAQSEPVASPLGVLMSLVSWVLYTHLVMRHRIVGALLPVRVAAIVLGLLALVVFPLLPQGAEVFTVLYKLAVVGGWLAGVRAYGRGRQERPAAPAQAQA